MRSASARHSCFIALAVACGVLLLGAAAGCSTTQETAAAKQAESARILKAREASARTSGKHQRQTRSKNG